MNDIPELDVQKIKRYAASRVPPQFHDQIRMEVDIRGKTVTIVECRPPWREEYGPERTREGMARMKYDVTTKEWTLYWMDSNERWHLYELIAAGPIGDILMEVEIDRTNIFWG